MRLYAKVLAPISLIFLFFVVGNVHGQTPVLPALPQNTVSLTFPVQGTSNCPTLTTGSNCIRTPGASASNFQSALNSATCGDTIVLQAGYTYSGNFTVPATSCTNNSGWIVIESSALASLPASGNRVGPSNASNMAVISTPNGSTAIQFANNANHWRLIGLEITTSLSNSGSTVYYLVAMAEGATSTSVLPSYIIFDRCYVYGSTVTPIQHGIAIDGTSIAVVDSYCDEIVDSGQDAQCLFAYNSTGPYLIQNNFLQASGENIMFGGADPNIPNVIPSDITIVGNLFQKNLAWQGVVSDVKNHFEIKNAQRVLLDGNVFQYTWCCAQSESIILRSVNQSGNCTWCSALDITLTHNLIQHAPSAIVVAAIEAPSNPSVPTGRILIRNNVMSDISCRNWGTGASYEGMLVEFGLMPAPYILHDITVDHNTGFVDSNSACTSVGGGFIFFQVGGSGEVLTNLQLTNNLTDYGAVGMSGEDFNPGTSTLTGWVPGGYVYGQNALLNATGTANSNPYPSGTFWNTLSGVGFTSYSGTDPNLSGNFQLTSSSSYHNAGTDGKDVGVWDWACFNYDTTAALAGNFVPNPGCTSSGSSLLPPPLLTGTLQ